MAASLHWIGSGLNVVTMLTHYYVSQPAQSWALNEDPKSIGGGGTKGKREERTSTWAKPQPASAGHTAVHEVTQSHSSL